MSDSNSDSFEVRQPSPISMSDSNSDSFEIRQPSPISMSDSNSDCYCYSYSNSDKLMGKRKREMRRTQMKKLAKTQGKSIMEMDIDEEVMVIYFEEDILMEILSRLPVRSLLRFRCVSKFWNRIISDPYFIRKHLSHAKKDQNSQKFLVSHICPKSNFFSLYCCPLSSVQPVEDVQELDNILSRTKLRFCKILSCYDGLAVVRVVANNQPTLFLWNPSTRESIVLPDPDVPFQSSYYGLGWDSTIGDYKIVKIRNGQYSSQVLELKSGVWRQITNYPRGIRTFGYDTRTLALVHNAFHWQSMYLNYPRGSREKFTVVSFNISNEVFGEIPLPEQILFFGDRPIFHVTELGGMLCVCSSSGYGFGRTDATKIWVLKDYCVKDSWIGLITIEDPSINLVQPKFWFADGEVLLRCSLTQGNEFVLRRSSGPSRLWRQSSRLQDGIAFTESLISPKSLIASSNV